VKVLVLASGANNSNFFGSQAGNSATNAYSSNFLVKMLVQTTAANNSNFFGENAGYSATTAIQISLVRSWLFNNINSNLRVKMSGRNAINAGNANFIVVLEISHNKCISIKFHG
jgi:hypothetical protein